MLFHNRFSPVSFLCGSFESFLSFYSCPFFSSLSHQLLIPVFIFPILWTLQPLSAVLCLSVSMTSWGLKLCLCWCRTNRLPLYLWCFWIPADSPSTSWTSSVLHVCRLNPQLESFLLSVSSMGREHFKERERLGKQVLSLYSKLCKVGIERHFLVDSRQRKTPFSPVSLKVSKSSCSLPRLLKTRERQEGGALTCTSRMFTTTIDSIFNRE